MDIFKQTRRFFLSAAGEKRVIGRSFFGREIYAVKIGSGAPVGIAQYAIHGREYLTARLAFHHFKRGVAAGSVWIVPLANPDGALLSQKGICSAPERARKRLIGLNGGNKDFSLWKANGNGVDLNVNFDARWGEGKSNARVPGSENYVGEKPFSEPETRALKNITEEIRPDYTVSFHTKGEEIYWRFYQTGMRTYRDYALAKALSCSTGYPLGDAAESCGGYKDWCIEKFSIPAFTVEAGRDRLSHPLPESESRDIVKKCGEALYDFSFAIKRATGGV
ncbi:MAG: M14 family zinc carboxypeptidase [Candidatus Borkfalkiaceae bacterium]|nr:M14 family zinc carboxypeptidase [Clostridia bacterium]MDY6223050.1 M14 family zinc carboxypeptidase [Christensenellaceae bacterium]